MYHDSSWRIWVRHETFNGTRRRRTQRTVSPHDAGFATLSRHNVFVQPAEHLFRGFQYEFHSSPLKTHAKLIFQSFYLFRP